jgi:hypothetical protein
MPTVSQFLEYLHVNEGTTSAFFSTSVQCIAALTGLSAALSTFHYQNLLGRIREIRDRLFEKYDPTAAGLKQEYADKYRRLRTLEEAMDFWRQYFEKEDRGSHHHLAFDDLYELIKQTRRFRFMVIRVSFYGFAILLPLGIAGTLMPTFSFLPGKLQLLGELAYMGLCFFYFAMSLTLARSVFTNPWPKK